MIPEQYREAFTHSLLAGRYNLLLGSGVTLDSRNAAKDPLLCAKKLRKALCHAVGAPDTTSLRRVASMLNAEQCQEFLTEGYSGCEPGPTIKRLPHYIWRRLFTFNIDDALESLYTQYRDRKQELIPINYNSPLEPTPSKDDLLAVHLHGWVGEAESGYVFSHKDYARIMRDMNPWMHMLSETLATEPYIISGTSLEEEDLEYYLSYRSPETPRRGRGPSLYIEPYPSVVTEHDCGRYGLILITATFGDFMQWLEEEYPSPPTLTELVVPDVESLFNSKPAPKDLIQFFSDFELVEGGDRKKPTVPSKFMYGAEPDWTDLHKHYDVEREDNAKLLDGVKNTLMKKSLHEGKVVILLDQPGTGKTTTLKRVAHDLVLEGVPVLNLRATSRLDTHAAKRCLGAMCRSAVLLVDGIADHAEPIVELLEDPLVAGKVVIAGSERSYRRDHLDIVFREFGYATKGLSDLTTGECLQLIEQYRSVGLIGSEDAIKRPEVFAQNIAKEPVAVSVCRILNDFRPLDRIIESLWEASHPADRMLYLCVALAHHCHKSGLSYGILQSIAGPILSANNIIDINRPLSVLESVADDNYLKPSNPVIGERILQLSSRDSRDVLRMVFENLALALAPHVNRKAIMKRTPEARLAGRLFDWDAVVHPLLGADAEDFYFAVKPKWEWNSRYWEQRALLASGRDLAESIQYARQAVAIEKHPHTLTTLGTILIRQMECSDEGRVALYSEALERLLLAITIENKRSRVTVYPFAALLKGTARYLELGGELGGRERDDIRRCVEEAKSIFVHDPLIQSAVGNLEAML